jgi:UDP-glucose 4-epimerase
MRCLITGCCGFIGSNLFDELKKQGHDVFGIDNLSTGKEENLIFDFFYGDISDPFTEQIFKDSKFDWVFHLAALPRIQPSIKNPIKCHEANVNGTLKMLWWSHKYKVKRFIYSASSTAYGENSIPYKENMTPQFKHPYGIQKLMGEMYCELFTKLYKLPTIILRYFNVYGERQSCEGAYATVIGIFLKQKSQGKSLTIVDDGEQRRDFTNVKDVVNANILAAKSDKTGVYNIGTNKNYSINEIADIIGGKKDYCLTRIGEVKETLADNSKAWKDLKWKPKVKLKDALKSL